MALDHYSIEASINENGKLTKVNLYLFSDEYSYGSFRKTVHWEHVECKRGSYKQKAFLRTIEKPSVRFCYAGEQSAEFIFESQQFDALMKAIQGFADEEKNKRLAKEREDQREAEKRKQQSDREQQIREEARRKADEEYRQRELELQRQREEAEQQARDRSQQVKSEKETRIQQIVEAGQNKPVDNIVIQEGLVKKAASVFLDNPYRILGIGSMSTNEEANTALDKLKKLARLKALGSYRSAFDLIGIEKPDRDLSVAQNALSLLKDSSHKFFWYDDATACGAWLNGKYRIELVKEGMEHGTYDLFLANYMYAVICDPNFTVSETWKRVLNYYCFICSQPDAELLRNHLNAQDCLRNDKAGLLRIFRTVIFQPILRLCDRDDLDAVIRLHQYIKDCSNSLLDGLSRNVLSKLVSWFTDKEADMFAYLNSLGDDETIPDSLGEEIRQRGEAYCGVVEPVLETVLRDFRGDTVRYDMIKESYRHTTYQLMYVLNKCANKSNAILFANKCYAYCNSDDKKRIQNTFGEANIKSIDWNTPHTGWDAKGDDFFFGRGRAVDYTQALYWYHKAADAGNMYSMNSIGLCYQHGHGVPQSTEQAVSWFEKAANAGNPLGAYNLAECYYAGIGVRKDIDQALKYWGEAAKLGHPSAAQRKESIFSPIQVQRRNHRARNHVCHDLGFQMTTGGNLTAEVTINQSANAYLVNAQGYQNYLMGNEFTHYGGYAAGSPFRICIPSSNHWYVIVDNGDESIAGIVSSVKVRNT